MDASYQGGVTYEDRGESFQQLSSTIASNIKKISQNVSSMSKMVNQLQTPQDSQELRNQLRQIQNYTQKMAKDTSSMIMDLMKMPVEQPAGKLTRERLSDEYMATLNAFQATQKSAAAKTKEDVRKVKAQSATINIGDPFGMSGRSNDLVEMDDKNTRRQEQMTMQTDQDLQQLEERERDIRQLEVRLYSVDSSILYPGRSNHLVEMDDKNTRRQEQMTMQTEQDLQQLEERERDIRQLESDILDVNQIFKELGTMIHDQGQVVDSIESSVEYTAHNVEAATAELRQASNYKNKLRKKKVYIAIILIVIVSIILIIVFNR
ncbi:syntaxin-7 [Cydia fagiglandana]|uniref:syntaxin-7 n=1 Tax=Cydia fagiglandana TaxID=1458189 RepID=UPI002FEE047E